MAMSDYEKAYRLGKKDYQYRAMHGMHPTLEVLDDVLPPKGSYSEVPLGLVQIPLDQVVGTKTNSRSNAFAGNFMPILRADTEFAHKWVSLSVSHVNEGIHTPIKAYEYMNKFYVEEGNKRVSVMKYFGVVSSPGMVTRIVPKRTEEKENKLYYEFMDFYDLSGSQSLEVLRSCRKQWEKVPMRSGVMTTVWISVPFIPGLRQNTRMREIQFHRSR